MEQRRVQRIRVVASIRCFRCCYHKRRSRSASIDAASCFKGNKDSEHSSSSPLHIRRRRPSTPRRKNLDLMISSLTAKISRRMSDKCPDIHQAFPPPQRLPTIRQRRPLKPPKYLQRRFSNRSSESGALTLPIHANPVSQEKSNALGAPYWGAELERPSAPKTQAPVTTWPPMSNGASVGAVRWG